MKAEIKALLKNELKAVSKSKTSILVGIAMIILDVALVLTSVFSISSLLFIIPLIIVIRKQIQEYHMNEMVLNLTRYLIDDEYSQTFKTETDEK